MTSTEAIEVLQKELGKSDELDTAIDVAFEALDFYRENGGWK